ncbi:hypothetical protein BDF20DRAFT_855924 [Mycotypha africana]|uniref:uncharacterized protein n=1 Tax=Mycotypha africana TaxID=64632 RepID=UPI00230064AE|nr:uncharacterized protein BDF20DRAFT_855924 [Mycotypha africana]KAI8988488.1 hypothetical protein BDF20DRAFT_855924 [Mycotypha africana]
MDAKSSHFYRQLPKTVEADIVYGKESKSEESSSMKQPKNTSMIQKTGNEQKTKKFGSFMGKILLLSNKGKQSTKESTPAISNKNTAIAQQPKLLTQRVLTEEPYADLFKKRRSRLEQTVHERQEYPFGKDVKMAPSSNFDETTCQNSSVKNAVLHRAIDNDINVTEPVKYLTTSKFHIRNGRKTRWDFKSTSANGDNFTSKHDIICDKVLQQPATTMMHKDIVSEIRDIHLDGEILKNDEDNTNADGDENDDMSSVDSLQSDDNVLGPWIELGLIENPDTDNNGCLNDNVFANDKTVECRTCSIKSIDREALQPIKICQHCQGSFDETFALLSVSKENSQNFKPNKKKKLTGKQSVRTEKSTKNKKKFPESAVRSISSNNRHSAKLIPPTKSQHSKKTDTKIKAAKKKQLLMTTATENNVEQDLKETSSTLVHQHVTTGAFLTRKTAQILADPKHGFYPNPYGFFYQQKMEVLNLNGHWYPGILEQMDKGKVKIRYLDWDQQEEWIIMGSRRLRKLDQPSITNSGAYHTIDERERDMNILKDNSSGLLETVEVAAKEDTLLSSLITTTKVADNTDYVNDTMDKDPKQIFNNNEVFMTRRLARMMCDEYGFRPNSFGYRRNRAVVVTCPLKGKGKGKKNHTEVRLGFLREMEGEQVRVWYADLHHSEWMVSGSRRLKVLTEDEEARLVQSGRILQNIDEAEAQASGMITSQNDEQSKHQTRSADEHKSILTKPLTKRSGKSNIKREPQVPKSTKKTALAMTKSGSPAISDTTVSTESSSSLTPTTPTDLVETRPSKKTESKKEEKYITTGAFATRTAMRQLQDENGFIPNPYGYVNNMLVEVLNTRSGKTKFWERARLTAMRPGQVKVHYEGWADIYDEWLMLGSRRIRAVTTIATITEDNNHPVKDTTTSAALALPDESTYASDFNCGQTNMAPSQKRKISNDLLITEENPELQDELKRKVKHKVVQPQDYQKLGLLVNMDELAAKQARKRELLEKKKLQNGSKNKRQRADKSGRAISNRTTDDGEQSNSEYDDDNNGNSTLDRRNFPKPSGKSRTRKAVPMHAQSEVKQYTVTATTTEADIAHSGKEDNDKNIISLRLLQAKALENNKFVANIYGYDYMQHVTVLSGDKKIYEGRLVSMHKNKVKVHFCGWPDVFDEYITLGSRRIQHITNDHEVQCIEPNYRETHEAMLLNRSSKPCCTSIDKNARAFEDRRMYINRHTRKRLTLEDLDANEQEQNEANIEYHKETIEEDEEVVEIDSWKVYCNQCNVVIKQFRYYCTYCETPSAGYDYQSFELCLQCFDQNFPVWHEHPRSSFAVQSVINADVGPRPIKGELVTIWEEDILEKNNESNTTANETIRSNNNSTDVASKPVENTNMQVDVEEKALDASKIFTGDKAFAEDQGYQYLKKWRRRKVCAFCNDDADTSEELGQFIGPFITATFNKNGVEKKRTFWAHDSCARYSPEVFCTPEGKWYNVTLALRRGRGMRCYACKEKGATIGCFESKCTKSFHLPCAQKPISNFKNGVIFWCKSHEAYYNKKDTYVNIFSCDGCKKQMDDESWFTCVSCASYFSSFDLCSTCYENFPINHSHAEDEFEETSFAIMKEMEAQKATEEAREKEKLKAANTRKRKKVLFPRRKKKLPDGSMPISCCYCGTYETDNWRKGYDGGVIMCDECFQLATLIDNDGKSNVDEAPVVFNYDDGGESMQTQQRYVTSIEDYSHKPYLTREALSSERFTRTSSSLRLATYEPQPHQLFSLKFDSTYFDIPGRAPRWATHSGTDYHGTWLPQTVRRAILKHTIKNERVLSTFLGRGTDAIECFLLQRKCCGVDINPAAVTLSQKNCSFEVPPGLTSAEYRPIIAQADSRCLNGALFTDESYHHILSHPPYKDCVAYSTHLDGDLSRFTTLDDFKLEYTKVVNESWR